MVSLMCSNLLRKVILEEKCNDPGKVLDIVSDDLLKRLDGKEEKVADGMDITLCFWNPSTNTLRFSGAHNPLYHIRGNQLDIYKTDKQPIGYFEDRKPFTTHQIEILENDQIVLFSDGIVDQFGGPKNKKFSSKRFRKEILEHQNLSLEAQKEKLAHTLELWQDSEEQIDDICILSVRF
jgi:serine phosphatase RsbU (regulator of sigma subunit)